jgi:DNA helicase II / ATP-dependent DNA helicase PcrA
MRIILNKEVKLDNNSISQEMLNTAQQEAVAHIDGPMLVLSGAGTGKTKVLTERIVHLISAGHALPDEILAVTFTNKAAKEMIYRISKKVHNHGLWLGTFHAIATKILRRHAEIFDLSKDFTVLGMDDQLKIIKRISDELSIDTKEYPPLVISGIIQRWKDVVLFPHHIADGDVKSVAHNIARKIYPLYQKNLIQNNAVDFGDLLIYNIEILSKTPEIQEHYNNLFKYILVDEYQDTNVAQYMWLRLLTGKNENLCCVGDEDQSIYGWRGAEIDNILRFNKDFPKAKIVRLEQNYRSTNHILATAAFLIAHNTKRLGKSLWSKSDQGEKVNLVTLSDDIAEAKYIANIVKEVHNKGTKFSDMAVLVRATFQTRLVEEYFVSDRIPYKILGGLKFYERQEIKDAMSYLRIVANFADNMALERIINTPRRGIGQSTMKQIYDFSYEHDLPLFVSIKKMLDLELFKNKVKQSLSDLIFLINKWNHEISNRPLAESLEAILIESGYINMWKNERSKEADAKIDNIKELVSVIKDFTSLTELLEYISLVNEDTSGDDEDRVNIMTIHAAKGLEFSVVISPGWEENVFPHQRVIRENNEHSIEEERRLAYVAITRAKYELYLTKAQRRKMFGSWQDTSQSRFVSELPQQHIKKTDLYFSNNDFSFKQYNKASSFQQKTFLSPTAQVRKFNIGDRVSHKKFGLGYVIAVEQDQVKISFDFYGTKILIDKFISKA